MRRVLGALLLIFGAVLACWIGYNLLIERQPEATGSPIPAIIFCIALFFVGGRWIAGESA